MEISQKQISFCTDGKKGMNVNGPLSVSDDIICLWRGGNHILLEPFHPLFTQVVQKRVHCLKRHRSATTCDTDL